MRRGLGVKEFLEECVNFEMPVSQSRGGFLATVV